ncbi:hypothetical protein [Variovorax sp. PMC12]|uniref:hypothetical protein n=1 Tax=Variovorax sp. PMC12 TaxID=2126319 RepID=UPI00131CE4B9|nr:hypothetical protein [Variovorax sp. PMC12]
MDFTIIPFEKINQALEQAEKAGAPDIEAACQQAAAELGVPVETVREVALAPEAS